MEPLEKSINQTDQAIDLVKQTIENTNRLKAEKEALRAENTRLREALGSIVFQLKLGHGISFKVLNEAEELLNPKPL
jgi:regulator of replication initiation timing